MGNHTKLFTKNNGQRVRGYRVIQQLDFAEVIPNWGNSTWLKVANRFQSLGVLLNIDVNSKRPSLQVSIDSDAVRAMLSGRSRSRKAPKVAVLGLVLPALLLLSTIPLRTMHPTQKEIVVVKSVINPCSPETIGRWLQGAGESSAITPMGASVLGGVTVGTLKCNGSRYSYTLGSEEPKRVLKLQKLDS